jgi:asparagine synthase (glutamine-hydrolysing)
LTNTVSERYRVKTGSLANYHNYQYYTPFYEPNILLETFAIPTKKIYYKGKGKQIFEQILYSHIDKKYYETYKKNGFGIPLVDWVKRMMLDDIKKISTQKFIKKQNLFDYQELSELINSFENQPNYNKGVVLWCYYVFQLWYKYNIND